ncbi:MAG: hypothetical protein COT91_04355 [Candidatus Doudnabacteria bacterium CG10_big_fil_rev_8_21_14_0_10_41_10]|uniref:Uncharacterized protein n=1 Tax=Candidatus Doudnabacteria bacterium CG10_big_fil_rev_8_21_14_0_10_41_10 TaxID=1974551 RepID=A0A2H0VCP5_9BACT|nr:MAG: hypothetical protein COT91_04355 [Candidatus Doudnabacteria bacterium CG10_big_fil_rev_8_21_14_0_10_41_10]
MSFNYFLGKQSVKIFIVALILLAVLVPDITFAQTQSGFSLVPCGTSTTKPHCEFLDLILLIVRLINFLLAASVIVALYYILLSGWGMMASLGNPEKLQGAKDGLTRAIIGFSLVLLSFAMINLLVQGIFGLEDCNWWSDPKKLWSSSNCLLP